MSVILWGQYPRSEQLVQATRDYDRGRIDDAKLKAEQKRDREALISLQKGFDYISTGQLHWEDLLRPLARLSPSLSAGALTRFFETNTFWRMLEGEGKVDRHAIPSWILEHFPQPASERATYSFPFWFLFNAFSSGPSLNSFLPLFEHLPNGLLLFIEPTFGWKPIQDDQKKQALKFIESLKTHTNSQIAVVTTFHNIKEELDYLYNLPVDGIGIDFYNNTQEQVLPSFPEDKFLIAGILDTDSTSIEAEESVRMFQSQAAKYLPAKRIAFSHSGPAELLPREVMDAKLNNLIRILA